MGLTQMEWDRATQGQVAPLAATISIVALSKLFQTGVTKDAGLRWTVFSDFGSVWATDFPSGVTKPDDQAMRSASLGLL